VLAIEHIEGLTAAQLVHRRACVPAAAAVPVAADLLTALHATHSLTTDDGAPLRALHRDVSPQNVVIDRSGIGHLIDFGASTDATFDGAVDEGHVVGKAGYMAPEVVGGGAAGPAIDQFAAGIVLWEMLTGRRLFRRDSDVSTWRSISRCEVPSLAALVPSIPRATELAVQRMLAAQPADRYPTCAAAADALRASVVQCRLSLDRGDLVAGRVTRRRAVRTVRLRPLKVRADTTLDVTPADVIGDAMHVG
jgi:serine/threonine protein kinase